MDAHYRVDRTDWASGPWDNEPDAVSWASAAGPLCEMRRGALGVWYGYVGTNPSHAVWQLDLERVLEAHGGITLRALSDEFACEPAMPPSLRWVGFDCMHAFDAYPLYLSMFSQTVGAYRDLAYVRAECENLAVQIDAIGLLEEAGFEVTDASLEDLAWAMEYARRFHVPRNERLAFLRCLASDPVAAQLARSMGIRG